MFLRFFLKLSLHFSDFYNDFLRFSKIFDIAKGFSGYFTIFHAFKIFQES